MPTYFCFIYASPDAVPELRVLDCEGDDQVAKRVAATLGEWPQAYRVEVTNGDRLVFATAPDAGPHPAA
ncbi:MAG: hypothetical protein EON87_08085 [Brevundimonas sp.]|nr:MAG: hypothetical protein EON87_08085 [Brevundimonas sp.]